MGRYEFNLLDQMSGGYSKSPRKVETARVNGRKCKKGIGGRPSTRTLIERILNRQVSVKEWRVLREDLLHHTLLRDQQIVESFFGVATFMDIPTKSWRSIPPQVRQRIRLIKAVALIFGRRAK